MARWGAILAIPRAGRHPPRLGARPQETRCRIVAIQEIPGRAFGKIPAEVKSVDGPHRDLEAVSEQKLDLVIRALEAAREAKRAQAQASEGEA